MAKATPNNESVTPMLDDPEVVASVEPFTDEERIAAGLEPIGTGSNSVDVLSTEMVFNDDELSDIKDFASALNAAKEATESDELDEALDVFGTGFEVVEKEALIGKEFIILQWRFYVGTYGPAVAVQCVTADNRKVVFNDGSTGIYEQIYTFTKKHGVKPILCSKGLRSSTYERTDKETGEPIINPKTGKPEIATTYYF